MLSLLLATLLTQATMSPTSDLSTNRVRATGASVARTLRDRFADTLNVKDFGAVCDDTTDDTSAIQAAVATGRRVQVPTGNCRVSGTIVVGQSQHLQLLAGAKLHRIAADPSTDELVRVSGPWAVLDGEGWVQSDKSSPRGVVRLGHANASGADSVLRSAVRGITIQGLKASGNIGLHVYSSEGYSGPGYVYECQVSDVHIRYAGTGVLMDRTVNGNTLSNLQFFNVAQYSYRFTNNSENVVHGGFTHFSADAILLKLESSSYNQFFGVLGEPGGTASRYFDMDAPSLWNLVVGMADAALTPIDAGTANTWIWGGQTVTPALKLVDGPSTTHYGRVTTRASAPTAANAPSGGWVTGDVVINSTPSIGQPLAWVCMSGMASFPPDGWWEEVEPVRKLRFDPAYPTTVTSTETKGSVILNSDPWWGRPMGWVNQTAGNPGTWFALPPLYPHGRVDVTYAGSMTIDPHAGDLFDITATNTTAFSINDPSNAEPEQVITIRVRNGSGGALGAVTWGAKFKMAAWVAPANGENVAISFRYRPAGLAWEEIARVSGVPN